MADKRKASHRTNGNSSKPNGRKSKSQIYEMKSSRKRSHHHAGPRKSPIKIHTFGSSRYVIPGDAVAAAGAPMELGFPTVAIHADRHVGSEPDVAPAIHVSSTYKAGNLEGNIYSRAGTTTRSKAEKAIGALEGGHAVLYSSGLAAIHSLISFVRPNVIWIGQGYHGTDGVIKLYQESRGDGAVEIRPLQDLVNYVHSLPTLDVSAPHSTLEAKKSRTDLDPHSDTSSSESTVHYTPRKPNIGDTEVIVAEDIELPPKFSPRSADHGASNALHEEDTKGSSDKRPAAKRNKAKRASEKTSTKEKGKKGSRKTSRGKTIPKSRSFGGRDERLASKRAGGSKKPLIESGHLIFLESPNNPYCRLVDIAAIARYVKSCSSFAYVAVDGTFATPMLQRPLSLGADFVVHSCTKFLGGHSDLLAGVVVSRQPPYSLVSQRTTMGNVPGSLETFLLLRSIRTLHVRFTRQANTALKLARWLALQSEFVARVWHPGLPSHPDNAMVDTLRSPSSPPCFSFELTSAELAERLPDHVKLFVPATSLGGVESLIDWRFRWDSHMPRTLVRISVGLEDVEDLIADFARAFSNLKTMGFLELSESSSIKKKKKKKGKGASRH